MELHLDHDQTSVLREVLDSALGGLRFEIADTDSAAFKRQLTERKQVLQAILSELTAQPVAST